MIVAHTLIRPLVPSPVPTGLVVLLGVWWLCGWIIAQDPTLFAFAGFAPRPALTALWTILTNGDALAATFPSLGRVLAGLGWALVFGAPIGLCVGISPYIEAATRVPFQLLRMVSPLSWMPLAILTFPTWNGAIVFLIAAAAIWPIIFATATGVRRIDPAWMIAGRGHGGRGWRLIRYVTIPAILPDLVGGLRLALGTAWIVLVPAEYLGVTSGLGYAINDARDTLSYDQLAAFILLIGLIGYALDALVGLTAKRVQWTPAT